MNYKNQYSAAIMQKYQSVDECIRPKYVIEVTSERKSDNVIQQSISITRTFTFKTVHSN